MKELITNVTPSHEPGIQERTFKVFMGIWATPVNIQMSRGAKRENFEHLETLDHRKRPFQSLKSTFSVDSFMH
jgi:hypothetical protein